MIKGAFIVAAGLFGLCLSLPAQETQPAQTDLLTLNQAAGPIGISPALDRATVFDALANERELPSLGLSDRQLFSFSPAFSWIETTPPDFLPALSTPEIAAASSRTTVARQSSSKAIAVQPDPIYAGGEVGVLYGKSLGKHGGSLEQGYILGEVGNDKFQVTAGAYYQESNIRTPRWGR